jgi:hypothetical protein
MKKTGVGMIVAVALLSAGMSAGRWRNNRK